MKVKLCWFIAKALPARLQYYAFNLVFAHSTTGNYGTTVVPEITAAEVSKRFYNDLLAGKDGSK